MRPCNPTNFTKSLPTAGGVQILWEVALESETAGYHLLRSTGGRDEAVPINDSLILTSSETVSADSPLRYVFTDTMATMGVAYAYWLQEVDVNGAIAEYGPIYSGIEDSRFNRRVYLPMVID